MNKYIKDLLNNVEYHQTGSRYYGNFTKESDWDILIPATTRSEFSRYIAEFVGQRNWRRYTLSKEAYQFHIEDGNVTITVWESYLASYLNDVITINIHNNLTNQEEVYQLLLTPSYKDYYIWIMISNYVKNNIETIINTKPEYLRVKDFFNILRKYITQKVGETGIDTESLIKDDKYVTQCVNELNHMFSQLTS